MRYSVNKNKYVVMWDCVLLHSYKIFKKDWSVEDIFYIPKLEFFKINKYKLDKTEKCFGILFNVT